jgi:hypothetical protein
MLLAETVETFAQYGLVGLMISAIFAGIAWAGTRLLGKEGVLEMHAKALDRVADCVQSSLSAEMLHSTECKEAHITVDRLHAASVQALNEISDECSLRGIDVRERISRVRNALHS